MNGPSAPIQSLQNGSNWQGLVPTSENLNSLRDFDLSSFSESQHTQPDSDNLSDDPFDSQDLIGICENTPSKTNTPVKINDVQKKDEVFMKQEAPSSPLFVEPCSSQRVSPPKSSQNIQQPGQVNTQSSPSRISLLGLPQRKKPKLEPQTRQLSTSAHEEDFIRLPNSFSDGSTSDAPGLYQQGPPKRAPLRAPLSNPTLQFATQKPLAPWERDALDSQSKLTEKAKNVTPFILSREQKYVMDLVLRGESLFFTGSAGTGKSILLKKTIKALKELYKPGEIAVTASTGLAAHHIGGTTVHSFSGIGLGTGTVEQLVKNVKRNRKAASRWKDTKVLIIDEVSMIDGRLLNKLDYLAREVRRKHHLPFGGIQLVLSGDFFQLPPVSKISYNEEGVELKDEAIFAFESDAWKACVSTCIVLEEVFRQKGDQKFIDMLNDMRSGLVTPESEVEFARLSRPLSCPAGIVPAELYATRNEVDRANNLQLSRLQGDAYLYEAIDSGELPPKIKSALLANFLAPPRLHLKKGAQVMCLKNFDEGLINGSIGKVIDFVDRDVYMGYELLKEDTECSYEEYKKRLQKKNIQAPPSPQKKGPMKTEDYEPHNESAGVKAEDKVIKQDMEAKQETLLDNVFDFFYEDGNGLKKPDIKQDKQAVETKEEPVTIPDECDLSPFEYNRRRKQELFERLQTSSKKTKYPLVRFTNPDNVTTRDVLVEPERWEHLNEKEEVMVARTQLPLMLAWALSIHKSQGLTLSHVRVNLNRIFEYGQAYVALSRAVSRDSLQVINFRRDLIRSSLIVKDFYGSLMTANEHRKLNS
ncbi:hypothetical protein FT663_02719 [Candidozyma haemuli var. vulneris]|uniref:ATP-dependent DNA helicase PIF1 n=1 Tax=Candidozyma haemuli TaxID=45357 RepID=A0A2V1ALF0_9ASCO|nr:hypothetical protein CXQ85_001423 [[Candida] haemuloni]KAF3989626.1 hypothetical protein FT662_02705 [[Candida] haemuloni var. vulneris]KAF3991421.1 hypothetical protein FT663_02719 [[Candida] haemuloni var. vulneris]PVH19127.1 hypothetical protein CXQ85_001423 [[Candida] haemuloni]